MISGGRELEQLEAWDRGRVDCLQDGCENSPFSCIGGLKRSAPELPKWIASREDHYRSAWLEGYLDAARYLYGDDWETCSFSWTPAVTVPADQDKK